ncbi:cell division protein FtsA [Fulvimarina sp. MAC3]|uniref:cell division protein FtsA n=1 Tax=Fulvimarina sp. MAC3 TaxID=3148887 RepID=UPI0031FE05AD
MSFLFRKTSDVPRMKPLSSRRTQIVSVLDIGSEKMSCMIGKLRPRPEGEVLRDRSHTIEVLGVGYQRSRGVKSGNVIDIEAAAKAIRATVDAAEAAAGLSVGSLIVSLTAGRLKSYRGSATLNPLTAITQSDVDFVESQAARIRFEPTRLALHSVPFDLAIDGEGGVENPVGMAAGTLSADMHVLTAEEVPLRNLEAALNEAHIEVEAFVATPYASALATLVEDEAAMGSAAIDMGSGTTTIAIFHNGHFVYADQVAIGGSHITMDIARGLSIHPADAERLKVVNASTMPHLADEDEILTIPSLGEGGNDETVTVSRGTLSKIVRPRVEEILELVRDRLNASNLGHVIGKRVVLTGGASQLSGLPDTARAILQRNVRLGRPVGVAGLTTAHKSPAFSAAVGLLIYPQVVHRETVATTSIAARMFDQSTRAGRFGTWLKRSI